MQFVEYLARTQQNRTDFAAKHGLDYVRTCRVARIQPVEQWFADLLVEATEGNVTIEEVAIKQIAAGVLLGSSIVNEPIGEKDRCDASRRCRTCLAFRFGLSFSEIARIFGVSRQAIYSRCRLHGSLDEGRKRKPSLVPNPESFATRFWSNVPRRGRLMCWLWDGCVNPKTGYGHYDWNGRRTSAHKVAFVLTYGQIPSGLNVLHTCDNRRCVNPRHLMAGTQKENCIHREQRSYHIVGKENRRLSQDDVRQIRALKADGKSAAEIARLLGRPYPVVYTCWAGKTYLWVETAKGADSMPKDETSIARLAK